MHPMYFGSSSRPLFGVQHIPAGTARATGIVILAPGLQEYGTAHWAMRSLASALAARGFHTLRFDYHGMGDSSGEPTDVTMEAWAQDARVAYDEMRDTAGIARVSFIGLRLGALVGTLASSAGAGLRDLVLWDPVVCGARYLDEIELRDATMRLRLLHPPSHASREDLAGYPLPRPVRESIARLDLRKLAPPAADRVAIFVAQPQEEVLSLSDAWKGNGANVTLHVSGAQASVSQAGVRQTAMLAGDTVSAVVACFEANES
jgi:pimeloyl-ACP methyl ester carboxylesterase